MGDRTGIAWTSATWNPIRGCARVSEGCRNCYAERVAARFSGPGQPYEGLARRGEERAAGPYGPRWTGEVRMVPEQLDQPLRWTKPRRIFVNSMSDLFHEKLTDEQIAAVFGVMAAAPQHTFQVLTKRPERMRAWFRKQRVSSSSVMESAAGALPRFAGALSMRSGGNAPAWPLPNVWLGVSVENQETADERIPLLLATPAVVRFISAEPLLSPIDLRGKQILALDDCQRCGDWRDNHLPTCQEPFCKCPTFVPGISWVIVGGESGPGARPCDVAWIRSIVEQCNVAGVACFVKQLGAKPTTDHRTRAAYEDWTWTSRVRDRKGGDSQEWPKDLRVQQFPATTEAP